MQNLFFDIHYHSKVHQHPPKLVQSYTSSWYLHTKLHTHNISIWSAFAYLLEFVSDLNESSVRIIQKEELKGRSPYQFPPLHFKPARDAWETLNKC